MRKQDFNLRELKKVIREARSWVKSTGIPARIYFDGENFVWLSTQEGEIRGCWFVYIIGQGNYKWKIDKLLSEAAYELRNIEDRYLV